MSWVGITLAADQVINSLKKTSIFRQSFVTPRRKYSAEFGWSYPLARESDSPEAVSGKMILKVVPFPGSL